MNSSGFNATTINGSSSDVNIRSVVLLIAAAFITSGNRVFRKDTMNLQVQATVTTAVGRVWFRDVLAAQGEASVSVVHRLIVRSIATAEAVATIVVLAYRRARDVLGAQAAVQGDAVAASKRASGFVRAIAEAVVATTARLYARDEASAQALVGIAVSGAVRPRTNVFSPISAPAQATITANSVLYARGPVAASAEAGVTAIVNARSRAPVSATATASIFATATGVKRIPFDRNAPDERTYVVPAIQTYYVVT